MGKIFVQRGVQKAMKKIKLTLIFIIFPAILFSQNIKLLINKDYLWYLTKYLNNAKHEIIISSFMWCCDPRKYSSFPCKLIDKIVDAVKRGVNVTIVLEKDYRSDNHCNTVTAEYFKYLLGRGRKNFKIFFDSPLVRSHQKIVLIDGKYCFIGSHNLTQSALKYNNEVSVFIESREIYDKLKRFILSVEKHGEEIY